MFYSVFLSTKPMVINQAQDLNHQQPPPPPSHAKPHKNQPTQKKAGGKAQKRGKNAELPPLPKVKESLAVTANQIEHNDEKLQSFRKHEILSDEYFGS